MRYGYFDNKNKEYVIDKIDVPFSMTNYLGVNKLGAVLNHTAGGYSFYKTPQYHRITRFRPNGVPMDVPGRYIYIRDNDSGDYFSVSWRPVGKNLANANYVCRHGLGYSIYECERDGVKASQTQFIPPGDEVELWDVKIKNVGGAAKNLSVFSYLEFSFHHIDMDNQNFQMSLYASGSSYDAGVIEYDLFYEEFGYQYFTSNFWPDGHDCVRDVFLGDYRTEANPAAVERGACFGSARLTGNHCASLQKNITLAPGEEARLVFILGQGKRSDGVSAKSKYSDLKTVDGAFLDLKKYWESKLKTFQIKTPDEGMNTSINIWNLYQAEVNINFSRFASFIEVGGRTGLGYRDTAQDAMCVPHSAPETARRRLTELLRGLTDKGYGLHLFDPAWFDKVKAKPFKSPTVVPEKPVILDYDDLTDVCSDDALWLIPAIVEYIKETGEFGFLGETFSYANGGEGTVFEHMEKIIGFSNKERGRNGLCKGLRADWNDCLNLGGGESVMTTFLFYWALENFIELLDYLQIDYDKYTQIKNSLNNLDVWDGEWYIRGITHNNKKIGTKADAEGKIHLESNAWAVASGYAGGERAQKTLDSIEKHLFTQYGILLNAPSYTAPDDDIGFVTRVYPGVKENGSVFSHSNPWAWVAECKMGNGERAKKYYDALLGYNQNDIMETRLAEPYSYCQFVMGRDHTAQGAARHPFMTGSAGWAYYAATKYILGARPGFDSFVIDPCVPRDWKSFSMTKTWRGAVYEIEVFNPDGVSKGVAKIISNGCETKKIPVYEKGSVNKIQVYMGAL